MVSKGKKCFQRYPSCSPSDKSVIERFIGAMFFWNLFSLQAGPESMDNPAENALSINSRPSPRARKERANSVQLRGRKIKRSRHEKPSRPCLLFFESAGNTES